MKILFKLLDYALSILSGLGALFAVNFIISDSWNMVIAMIVGMLLGMVVLALIAIIFIQLTTAFELLPSGMLITMPIGMVVGMLEAVVDVDFALMITVAAIFSFSVQFCFNIYNARLKGEVPIG